MTKITLNTRASSNNLFEVLTKIDNTELMKSFLCDILTKKEIDDISMRLLAARMLIGGCKYQDISDKTGLSSRTIARISSWIRRGNKGYSKIIGKNSHIEPVCAD